VGFTVTFAAGVTLGLAPGQEDAMTCATFVKAMKLETRINLSNMMLVSPDASKVTKYRDPLALMEGFYHIRREMYVKRKAHMVDQLKQQHMKLDNQARFILEVVNETLTISKRKEVDIVNDLVAHKYDRILSSAKMRAQRRAAASSDAAEGDEESNDLGGFEYLLSMNIRSLTMERVNSLRKKLQAKLKELEVLQATGIEALWETDLEKLLEGLDEFEAMLREEEEEEELKNRGMAKGPKKKKGRGRTKSKKRAKKPAKRINVPAALKNEVVSVPVPVSMAVAPVRPATPPPVVDLMVEEEEKEEEDEEEDEIPLSVRMAKMKLKEKPKTPEDPIVQSSAVPSPTAPSTKTIEEAPRKRKLAATKPKKALVVSAPSSSQGVFRETDLKKLKVSELKQLLRDRKLLLKGKKAELIARLLSHAPTTKLSFAVPKTAAASKPVLAAPKNAAIVAAFAAARSPIKKKPNMASSPCIRKSKPMGRITSSFPLSDGSESEFESVDGTTPMKASPVKERQRLRRGNGTKVSYAESGGEDSSDSDGEAFSSCADDDDDGDSDFEF